MCNSWTQSGNLPESRSSRSRHNARSGEPVREMAWSPVPASAPVSARPPALGQKRLGLRRPLRPPREGAPGFHRTDAKPPGGRKARRPFPDIPPTTSSGWSPGVSGPAACPEAPPPNKTQPRGRPTLSPSPPREGAPGFHRTDAKPPGGRKARRPFPDIPPTTSSGWSPGVSGPAACPEAPPPNKTQPRGRPTLSPNKIRPHRQTCPAPFSKPPPRAGTDRKARLRSPMAPPRFPQIPEGP